MTRGRIAGDLRRIRGELGAAIALCRAQGDSVSWGDWLISELRVVREHTLHDRRVPAGVLLERMFRMYRLSYTLSYVQLAVAWEAVLSAGARVGQGLGGGRLRRGDGNRLGLGTLDAPVIWRRCVRWFEAGKRLISTKWATIHHGSPIMAIG